MRRTLAIAIALHIVLGSATFAQERNAAYYKKLGDDERIQQNALQAIEYYKKSIQRNKNYVPALEALGALLRDTGAARQSRKHLERAHKLEPRNESVINQLAQTYLALRDYTAARKIVRRGVKLSPYKADFNYLMAVLYMLEGRLYLARKKLAYTIRSNPNHYLSHIAMGELLLKEKRYKRAEKAFEKAQLIQPENPDIFIRLADIRLNQITDRKDDLLFDQPLNPGVFKEPIDLLMNAKGFNNTLVAANFRLAQIYALSNDFANAQIYLKSVLAINPQHYAALYYGGYANPSKSLQDYPRLLKLRNNDEITRYGLERNMLKLYSKRAHPNILSAVRDHYKMGKNLMAAYKQVQALYEFRWAKHLYPGFLQAHKELLEYYRTQRDFVKIQEELDFLRRVSKNVKYRDMYEQFVQERRKKLFFKEGIPKPTDVKSPTPLFVFYLKPKNPFGDFPDAGRAVADKLTFILQTRGRLSVLSNRTRSLLYDDLTRMPYFGLGGQYNGRLASYVKKRVGQIAESGSSGASERDRHILRENPLRFAIAGSYREIPNGLAVKIRIMDLETGLARAPLSVKASGKGFLRNLAIKMSDHIYKNIPFEGRILKISRNGAVVNLGRRDGIKKNSKLAVFRNDRRVAELTIQNLDMDILWARTKEFSNIYRIQPNDVVRVATKKKRG